MDWITVIGSKYEDTLQKLKNPEDYYGKENEYSILLSSYISSVDTLQHAINALCKIYGIDCKCSNRNYFPKKPDSKRLAYNTVKTHFLELDYVPAGDSSAFDDIIDDDSYFSKIRACFSTHMDDIKEKKAKADVYFACWSSWINDSIWGVNLYCYSAGMIDLELTLDLDQIDRYAKYKYNKLNELIYKLNPELESRF